MKIAQIAPLAESVPPKLYGGTERIVSFLTEELVRLKHDVTLFASSDSQTDARLVPACEVALRLSRDPVVDSIAHYIRLLELVFRQAHEFDILHFHIDYLHFPLTRRQSVPAVTTLHGKLTIPEPGTPLPRILRYAGGLDLGFTAPTSTLDQLSWHGLPRFACRSFSFSRSARRLSCVPWSGLPGEEPRSSN